MASSIEMHPVILVVDDDLSPSKASAGCEVDSTTRVCMTYVMLRLLSNEMLCLEAAAPLILSV